MDHDQHVDGDTMPTNSLVTAASQVELRQDLERIESLRKLADDWNTYGGVPVTERAAVSAANLLRSLVSRDDIPKYGLVRPRGIAPLASGGLNLEWRGPRAEMTIEVYPDGRLGSYVVESHDGETIERDEEDPAIGVLIPLLLRVVDVEQAMA